MSDSIDRNAAINALNMLFKKQVTQFGYEGYEKADEKTQLVCDGISCSIECLMNLPSAQPKHTEERTETHARDCISREDAKWVVFCNRGHVEDQANAIDSLPCVQPSAQPQHEVRFSDADHVWIDGKQYISLRRFMEAVKDARKDAYKHGKSKGIKRGMAMARRKEAGGD